MSRLKKPTRIKRKMYLVGLLSLIVVTVVVIKVLVGNSQGKDAWLNSATPDRKVELSISFNQKTKGLESTPNNVSSISYNEEQRDQKGKEEKEKGKSNLGQELSENEQEN